MQDQWYGDNKDLVKWGVLIHLAQLHQASRILHVAYHRPTEWKGLGPGQWPSLSIGDVSVKMPDAVLQHFRDIRRASGLTSFIRAQLSIGVLDMTFEDRGTYQRAVLEAIQARESGSTTVVLLDPDTGLAPESPSLKHILESEVWAIWAALIPRDLLVLYQHQTNRNGRPWIAPKKKQFEQALGLEIGSAKCARSERIARDVAFFYAQKTG